MLRSFDLCSNAALLYISLPSQPTLHGEGSGLTHETNFSLQSPFWGGPWRWAVMEATDPTLYFLYHCRWGVSSATLIASIASFPGLHMFLIACSVQKEMARISLVPWPDPLQVGPGNEARWKYDTFTHVGGISVHLSRHIREAKGPHCCRNNSYFMSPHLWCPEWVVLMLF